MQVQLAKKGISFVEVERPGGERAVGVTFAEEHSVLAVGLVF